MTLPFDPTPDYDPFAEIPDVPKTDITGRVRESGQKIDPVHGSKAKSKTPDYASIARAWWRDQGYIVGQAQTVNTNYFGGRFAGVTTKDLYGIVDFIGVNLEGEVVFVQATSKPSKSAHIRKIFDEFFKIGNGTPVRILEVVERIARGPVRFVIHCPFHDGPGAKWQHEFTEVTPQQLDTWKEKRARRGAAEGTTT